MNDKTKRQLKKFVSIRANGRCEYCRMLEYMSKYEFHLEHIIGIQHGGSLSLENLAYACPWCNWKKGPNIATILEAGGELIPLFNPRTQNWFDHFEVGSNGFLSGKSSIGTATIKLLELNNVKLVEERKATMKQGFYP